MRSRLTINSAISDWPHIGQQSSTPIAGMLVAITAIIFMGDPEWSAADTITLTTNTPIGCSDFTYDGNDIVVDGCTVTIDCEHQLNSLEVRNNGIVTHTAGGEEAMQWIVAGNVEINAGSAIHADGKGHASDCCPGAGEEDHSNGGGGGYGGEGSPGYSGATSAPAGPTCGLSTEPTDLGSGGGGRIAIFYTQSSFTGTVNAFGGDGYDIGGADGTKEYEEVTNHPPGVSNVTVSQRTNGSRLVDIYYDLVDIDNDACGLSVQASDNGGATWVVPIASFNPGSDVGSGITPGSNKHIIWNSAADLPGASGTEYMVRVCAYDSLGGDMVLIPGGEFQMGDHYDNMSTALPVHTVYNDTFSIDCCEVTNQKYAEALNWADTQGGLIQVSDGVVKKLGDTEEYCDTTDSSSDSCITWNGSTFGVTAGKEDHPMALVSWYGSVAYCNWRSTMESKPLCYDLSTWECNFGLAGYRLPTEAEWEKAAGWDPVQQRHFRFGEHSDGCSVAGDCLSGMRANYDGSADPFERGTTPVGYYDGSIHDGYQTDDAKSYYGCYDMSGNVWEWCNDWFTAYDAGPAWNPTGASSQTQRVLRGGSYVDSPSGCRSARRSHDGAYGGGPETTVRTLGFRRALGILDGLRESGCGESAAFSLSWPQPELVSFFTSEESVVIGESFDVQATLRNIGTNGDHGGIAISFPELTYPDGTSPYRSDRADVEIHSDTTFSTTPNHRSNGDPIETATGAGLAEHLLFEGDEPNWSAQEEYTLRLTVTPKEPGPLTIRARGWIADGGDDGYGPPVYRDPKDGDGGQDLDQQGFWSDVLSVEVLEPASTSGMQIDRWWAFTDETTPVELIVHIAAGNDYELRVNTQGLPNGWHLSDNAVARVDGDPTGVAFGESVALIGFLGAGEHSIVIDALDAPSEPMIERTRFELRQQGEPLEMVADIEQMFVADRRGLTEADVTSSTFEHADGTPIERIGSVQVLADTFAPRLFFDSRENYFPQSVALTLDEFNCGTSSVLRDAGGNPLSGDPTTPNRLLELASQYGTDEELDDLWIDLPCGAPLEEGARQGGFPLYATAVLDGDTIAISYYIHYRYSNWAKHWGLNNHEGDWECAMVFLERSSVGEPFVPSWVAYSQHEKRPGFPGGSWAYWSVLDLVNLIDDQTHPRLYVAAGSHASYFLPACSVVTPPLLDWHDGLHLNPPAQGSTVLLRRAGDVIDASTEGAWLLFPGRWGQQDLPDNWQPLGDDGPLGPLYTKATSGGLYGAYGERWFDPAEWPGRLKKSEGFEQWRPGSGSLASSGEWDIPCSSNGVCDDDNPCTEDVCSTGVCRHCYEPAGTPCGDQSSGDCDDPNVCDGYGICSLNHVPNGTPCSTDGFECTANVCEHGACAHPDAEVGSACGDQSNTFCHNPDGCDGYGNCVPGPDPCPDQWCDTLLEGCVAYGDGDFDVDQDVDLLDFALFQSCFGYTATSNCFPANFAGDDGMIDLADYVGFEAAFTGP